MAPKSKGTFFGSPAPGFSLMELLVVVSILSILISLLLPSLSRMRDEGRTTKCLNNQHQLNVALNVWANDHSGTLPGAMDGGAIPTKNWASAIETAGPKIAETSLLVTNNYTTRETFICPEGAKQLSQIDNYIFSGFGVHYTFFYAANVSLVGTIDVNEQATYGPTMGPLVGKSATPFHSLAAPPANTLLTCDRTLFVSYTDTLDIGGQIHAVVSPWHHGKTAAIVTYADGHGGTVKSKQNDYSIAIPSGAVPTYLDYLGSIQEGQ